MFHVRLRLTRRTILGDALSRSTFHGLPRIATGRDILLRLFWICIVISALITLSFHGYHILIQYLKRDLKTSVDYQGMRFEFPDIFLCPRFSVSESFYLEEVKKAKGNYKERNRFQVISENMELASTYQNSLETSAGFASKSVFESFDMFWETVNFSDYYDILGHKAYQVFIKIYIKGREQNSSLVEFSANREHTYCFKVSVSSSQMNYSNEDVTFLTFLESEKDVLFKLYMRYMDIAYDFRTGVRIYFTERGQNPSFHTQYVHIRPGYFYDIRLRLKSYKMQNISRRRCYSQEFKFVDPFFHDKVYYQSDFYRSCIDYHHQMLFVSQCHCYVSKLTRYLIPLHIARNHPSCFNLSTNPQPSITTLINRIKCYARFNRGATIERETYLDDKCRNYFPCEMDVYIPHWSFRKWPADQHIDEVIDNFLIPELNTKLEQDQYVPGWMEYMNRTHGYRRYLARGTLSLIKIRSLEFLSTVFTEEIGYMQMNLWSDIGGILGLYLGLSFMTLFETVEIVYNFTFYLYHRKSMKGEHKLSNKPTISMSKWI